MLIFLYTHNREEAKASALSKELLNRDHSLASLCCVFKFFSFNPTYADENTTPHKLFSQMMESKDADFDILLSAFHEIVSCDLFVIFIS